MGSYNKSYNLLIECRYITKSIEKVKKKLFILSIMHDVDDIQLKALLNNIYFIFYFFLSIYIYVFLL